MLDELGGKNFWHKVENFVETQHRANILKLLIVDLLHEIVNVRYKVISFSIVYGPHC